MRVRKMKNKKVREEGHLNYLRVLGKRQNCQPSNVHLNSFVVGLRNTSQDGNSPDTFSLLEKRKEKKKKKDQTQVSSHPKSRRSIFFFFLLHPSNSLRKIIHKPDKQGP